MVRLAFGAAASAAAQVSASATVTTTTTARCTSRVRMRSTLVPAAVLHGRRWMSVRPETPKDARDRDVSAPPRKKITLQRLLDMKHTTHEPITMLTAYDYPTARLCSAHNIDITLVGDSLAQVALGYPSTTHLTLPELLHHLRAVARGTTTPLLVADMPFGSFHPSTEHCIRSAVRIIQHGSADAVKLEGADDAILQRVRALTALGIPTMAHIGLLPQRATALSGYRVQARDAGGALALLRAARTLEDAGAFAIVLEAVPAKVATYVTQRVGVPTIGIGAGVGTDGQVLVWDDMVGMWEGHQAKFVRRFADAKGELGRGVRAYIDAVRGRKFPDESESYGMDDEQWEVFLRLAEKE